MKIIIGFMAMLLPILSGAQAPPVKALSIGDTVPDISFTGVYNYSDSTINYPFDLKNKFVILDFWSTWCGPCIRSMPRFDSLQKKFKDKLEVVVITRDSPSRVSDFFDKHNFFKNGSLSFFAEDSLMLSLFPYKTIPHEIWVGSDQRIKAITGSAQVTQENVKLFLEDIPLHFPVKED